MIGKSLVSVVGKTALIKNDIIVSRRNGRDLRQALPSTLYKTKRLQLMA
jgi:hypothetical protein